MKWLRALPLFLTFIRLALGPLFLIAYKQEKPPELLAVIVGLAVLTDWLDGLTARRWNAVSALGKLLDPFADALFCMIVFMNFAMEELMPLWIVIMLVGREVLVTFVLRPLALWRGVIMAAGMLGKIKTVCQFVTILLVLAVLRVVEGELVVLDVLRNVSYYVTLGFSLASGGVYAAEVARAYWNLHSSQREKAERSNRV